LTAIGRAMPLLTGDFTREELVLKLAEAGPASRLVASPPDSRNRLVELAGALLRR
jgi:hypothetical protein